MLPHYPYALPMGMYGYQLQLLPRYHLCPLQIKWTPLFEGQ